LPGSVIFQVFTNQRVSYDFKVIRLVRGVGLANMIMRHEIGPYTPNSAQKIANSTPPPNLHWGDNELPRPFCHKFYLSSLYHLFLYSN